MHWIFVGFLIACGFALFGLMLGALKGVLAWDRATGKLGLLAYRLLLGICSTWAAVWLWIGIQGAIETEHYLSANPFNRFDYGPAGPPTLVHQLTHTALVAFVPLAVVMLGQFLHEIRKRGQADVDDLVNRALLDPNLARDLLNRVRPR